MAAKCQPVGCRMLCEMCFVCTRAIYTKNKIHYIEKPILNALKMNGNMNIYTKFPDGNAPKQIYITENPWENFGTAVTIAV